MMLRPIDKRAAARWAQLRLRPGLARLAGGESRKASGPSIAVLGNCQSFSIAYSMKLMLPDASVDHYPLIGGARIPLSWLARTLRSYDYAFVHHFPVGHLPGGDYEELERLAPGVYNIPEIAFAAFHPDNILIDSAGMTPVCGPLGPYHSALALFAFRKGYSLELANALFDRNVFDALGYFGFWDDAREALFKTCAERGGLDLTVEFLGWTRRGVFMHSINHPKPYVLLDVAKKALERVGFTPCMHDFERYLIDEFVAPTHPIFPIYPPIGDFFGVAGSFTFRAKASSGVPEFLSLPEFIGESYRRYAAVESQRLSNPRVDAWLADAETTASLFRLAQENLAAGRLSVR